MQGTSVHPTVIAAPQTTQQTVFYRGNGPQGTHLHQQTRPEINLDKFNSAKARKLAIAQIVTGLICMISNITAIPIYFDVQDEYMNIFIIGFGLYSPIFYFASGGLAISIHKHRSQLCYKRLKNLLGISVFASILALSTFSWSCAAVALVAANDETYDDVDAKHVACIGLASMIMVCSIVTVVTTIWICKLCGDVICKSQSKMLATVQYFTTTNPDGTTSHQVIMTSPHTQQQMIIPQQTQQQQQIIMAPQQQNVPYPQQQTVPYPQQQNVPYPQQQYQQVMVPTMNVIQPQTQGVMVSGMPNMYMSNAPQNMPPVNYTITQAATPQDTSMATAQGQAPPAYTEVVDTESVSKL